MSNIIADLEKGAVVLVHDLVEPPADGSALPAELTQTVEKFGQSLGIPPTLLGDVHKGWLFDLMNMAVEAVSGAATGHAAAGGTSGQADAGVPAGSVPGADAPAETVPASQDALPAASPGLGAIVDGQVAAPTHGPADVDLPPVTEPDAGYAICPECNGFRTVIVGGVVSPCPKCKGAGQLTVQTAA